MPQTASPSERSDDQTSLADLPGILALPYVAHDLLGFGRQRDDPMHFFMPTLKELESQISHHSAGHIIALICLDLGVFVGGCTGAFWNEIYRTPAHFRSEMDIRRGWGPAAKKIVPNDPMQSTGRRGIGESALKRPAGHGIATGK